MATTDIVEIVIEVVNNTKDDLAEIRAELEAIGARDINVDLDINAASEVAKTEAMLQGLDRTRVSPNMALPSGPDMPALPEGGPRGLPGHVGGLPALPGEVLGGGGGGGPGMFERVRERILGWENAGDRARRGFRRVGKVLDTVTPNIMMVWNAMAALIPVFVTLGGAAIGLAGALLTLGAAAAAIVGIGLLGWGDTFSESMSNASSAAEDLGSTIFDILQPVANTFQPILQGWMEGAPRQVQRLVEPLQQLAVFSDAIAAAGTGFVGWLDKAIRAMVGMEQQIEQMALRFGEITGTFIIDFMQNMTEFAYNNQTALIRLASTLRELLGILLNVSVVLASTISALSPLVDIVGFLAEMLNTRLGRALVTGIGLLLLLETTISSVLGVMALMRAGMAANAAAIISRYIPSVLSAIGVTQAWIASLSALKAALLTTGLGALVVGAGYAVNELMGSNDSGPSTNSIGGGGTSSGSGGTYINVEGDVGRREMDRLLDTGQVRAGDEHEILEGMNNG